MRNRLDQRITGQQVDPAAETRWFHPLPRAGDLVDLRVAEPDRAEASALSIVDGCGSSRSRRRAASSTYALLLSLAMKWLPLPPEVLPALAAALDVVPTTIDPNEFDGDEERTDGPSRAEVVALQLIAASRCHGRNVTIRRAAYALVEWYQRSGRSVPYVVANAVGVVLGAVEPIERAIADETFAHLLGTSSPDVLRDTVAVDAKMGRHGPPTSSSSKDHGERLGRKWRGGAAYAHILTMAKRKLAHDAAQDAAAARAVELREALAARSAAVRNGTDLPPLPEPVELPGIDHAATWLKWNRPKASTR